MADSVTCFCLCVQSDTIDNCGFFVVLSLVNPGRGSLKKRDACWPQSHVCWGGGGAEKDRNIQAGRTTDRSHAAAAAAAVVWC